MADHHFDTMRSVLILPVVLISLVGCEKVAAPTEVSRLPPAVAALEGDSSEAVMPRGSIEIAARSEEASEA
jgi:hypothetical protein